MYRNERGVGEAIRASGLDREDVYVKSKLNNSYHRPADARHAFAQTLSDSGSTTSTCSSFTGRSRLSTTATSSRPGKPSRSSSTRVGARSIGVSNFQVAHLERLAAENETVPAVNQIELTPTS